LNFVIYSKTSSLTQTPWRKILIGQKLKMIQKDIDIETSLLAGFGDGELSVG
jgi:hypothetical protein